MDTNRWLAAKQTSIVDKYADQASGVYAPLQRDGRFPDTRPADRVIETEHFVPATAAGLQALENFLPRGALDTRIKVRRSCNSDRMRAGLRTIRRCVFWTLLWCVLSACALAAQTLTHRPCVARLLLLQCGQRCMRLPSQIIAGLYMCDIGIACWWRNIGIAK